ncbi:MAG: hypothetical protein ACI841_000223 [Planctomycetota bacterium]|jgi:hypothetical protein
MTSLLDVWIRRLRRRWYGRAALDSGKWFIYRNEFLIGEVGMRVGHAILFEEAIPADVQGRDFVSLRIVSIDYASIGEDLRKCRSAGLTGVSIE